MKQASVLIFISRFINIISYNNLNKSALQQENIFIAVKTKQSHERTRLPIILDTWFTLARDQVWFYTDQGKSNKFKLYQNITKNHMVIMNCPKTQSIIDICCKTGAELNVNLTNNEGEKIKWLCLFDDDSYVNVPKLVEELQKYDYKKSWYLGRKYLRGKPSAMQTISNKKQYNYYFAKLGAGVCLSRTLLLEMEPYLRYDGFMELCRRLRLPDAITLGFLIEKKVGVNLTDVPTFHSYLDGLKNISSENLKYQISISYDFDHKRSQIITVPGFDLKEDPSRFYSLHCFLGFCSGILPQPSKPEVLFNCSKSQTSHNPHKNMDVEVITIPSTSWTPGQSTVRYQPTLSPSRQTTVRYQPTFSPSPPNTVRYQPIFSPSPQNTARYQPIFSTSPQNTVRYQPIFSPSPQNIVRYQPIFSPFPQNTVRYQPIFSPSRQNSRKSDPHQGSKLGKFLSKSPYHAWAYHGV